MLARFDIDRQGHKNQIEMNELPMPSDLRAAAQDQAASQAEPIEPPSVKLIVRLFVIPLLIVAAAVGVMFLVGLMAGREPTLEEAMTRLRAPGGERTATYLVGPASKQRYLDAQSIVKNMKAPEGMSEPERIALAAQLLDILDNHTSDEEGQIQHFITLALARTWQKNPAQPAMESTQAVQSRDAVAAALIRYADAKSLDTRKAAVLASAYLAGYEQAAVLIPKIIDKLNDGQEDIDVRIAAATVLGPLGDPSNATILMALNRAIQDSDPRHVELVWSAALSLAELNQPAVADTILKLLDRNELSQLQYYDRETDPKNPTFKPLSEKEQQRILINTMIGAQKLDVPAVQAKLKQLTESDPSPRVREAGREIMDKGTRRPSGMGIDQ